MKKITVAGQIFNIHWITGKVVSQTKHVTTHVSGGGGGSYGSGYTASVSISSINIIHNDIIIKDSNGKEHSHQLSGFDIVCKEEQELSIVWAVIEGQDKGDYVLVINHNTDAKYFCQNPGWFFPQSKKDVLLANPASGGCLVGIISWLSICAIAYLYSMVFGNASIGVFVIAGLAVIIAPIIGIIYPIRRRKKLDGVRNEIINQFKSEILAIKI